MKKTHYMLVFILTACTTSVKKLNLEIAIKEAKNKVSSTKSMTEFVYQSETSQEEFLLKEYLFLYLKGTNWAKIRIGVYDGIYTREDGTKKNMVNEIGGLDVSEGSFEVESLDGKRFVNQDGEIISDLKGFDKIYKLTPTADFFKIFNKKGDPKWIDQKKYNFSYEWLVRDTDQGVDVVHIVHLPERNEYMVFYLDDPEIYIEK